MNFIPYKPDENSWAKHFSREKKRRKTDGLYIIKDMKQIGNGSLRIVTPSEEVVRRAKASLDNISSESVKTTRKRTYKKKTKPVVSKKRKPSKKK